MIKFVSVEKILLFNIYMFTRVQVHEAVCVIVGLGSCFKQSAKCFPPPGGICIKYTETRCRLKLSITEIKKIAPSPPPTAGKILQTTTIYYSTNTPYKTLWQQLASLTQINWLSFNSVSDPGPFVRIRIKLFFLRPDPDRQKIQIHEKNALKL